MPPQNPLTHNNEIKSECRQFREARCRLYCISVNRAQVIYYTEQARASLCFFCSTHECLKLFKVTENRRTDVVQILMSYYDTISYNTLTWVVVLTAAAASSFLKLGTFLLFAISLSFIAFINYLYIDIIFSFNGQDICVCFFCGHCKLSLLFQLATAK